ncbi:MAG: DUF4230 domain-containing protein [Candidatus Roizmanbacteria bacterium]
MKQTILIKFIIVLILIISISAYFIFQFAFNPKVDQKAIITQIQQLQRLETSRYTLEKVITKSAEDNAIRQFLFGDKILLIAHGTVIGGIDLSQVKEQDIQISNKKIHITLPPSEILSSKLDNEKTQVYDRTTGIFTKGDLQLESQARAEAEKAIVTTSCQDGAILQTSADNAKKQIETILKALGFQEIEVFAPVGSCKVV